MYTAHTVLLHVKYQYTLPCLAFCGRFRFSAVVDGGGGCDDG